MADPRRKEGRGACAPPPPILSNFFRRVRNLSQNAGNGHFKDKNLQIFRGGTFPQTPLESLCLSAHGAHPTPPPLKVLDLPLFGVNHCRNCRIKLFCLPLTILKETLFNCNCFFYICQMESKKGHHIALYRWFPKLKASSDTWSLN